MSRIPVSHKNRIRGETRDRIRSELNISTVQQTALDLKADISSLGTAAYADLTTSPTDPTVGRVLKVGDVINAGTLDSLDSTQFLRSDFTNTLNGALILGGSSVSGAEGGEIVFTKAPFSTHTGNPYLDSHADVLRYISSAGGVIRALTLPAETGTVLHDTGDSTITGSFLADDPATTTDWNTNWKTGFYNGNSAANAPETGWCWGLKSGHINNSAVTRYGMDLVVSLTSAIPYIRNTIGNGTGTWQQIHTTGSLAFLQNQSGGTLGSTATVAGSSLFPTQVGTWRNVSGGDILNNGWGLWGIV